MNFGRRVFPQPIDPYLDLRVSDLYRSMPRRSIRQGLLPSESLFLLDSCSRQLRLKSERYRSLSKNLAAQTLANEFPGSDPWRDACLCQRALRLAQLCRSHSRVDSSGARSLTRRVLRFRISRDGVQQRLQDYRFASHTFPGRNSGGAKGPSKFIRYANFAAAFGAVFKFTGGHVQDVNLLDELLLEHINSNDHSAEPNLISNQVPESYFDSSDLLQ